MRRLKLAFYLLPLVAGLAGCIGEDLSDCPSPSSGRLILSYKGDGATEIFPQKICRVEMYVFDAENHCVASGPLSREEVDRRTAQLPPLQKGDYRIICLGNTHHSCAIGIESGDFHRMMFTDNDYAAGNTVAGNDSLYYASRRISIKTDEPLDEIIEFASSHYDLMVEVAGLPDPAGRSEPNFPLLEIRGATPCTDFENQACGETTDYRLKTVYDAASRLMTAQTNIMRHTNHQEVDLRLLDSTTGESLAEVNFAEFLAEHPSIDCSKHEVLIPIRIEFISGRLEISVPDWFVEKADPEF